MINSSLPTDNLYKFMAIAGLVVFLFGGYTFVTSVRDSQAALWQRLTETRMLDLEQDRVESWIARLEERVALAEEDSEVSERALSRLRDEHARIAAKNATLSIRLTKAEENRLLAANENTWALILQVSGFLCASFGALLAYFGFSLWYKRVQVYQDRALKKAAKSDTP